MRALSHSLSPKCLPSLFHSFYASSLLMARFALIGFLPNFSNQKDSPYIEFNRDLLECVPEIKNLRVTFKNSGSHASVSLP